MNDKELSHLEQLELRHRELDRLIKEGYTNYVADENLTKMKQEKLQLKRQIEELKKKAA